jgi:hypothetical protein
MLGTAVEKATTLAGSLSAGVQSASALSGHALSAIALWADEVSVPSVGEMPGSPQGGFHCLAFRLVVQSVSGSAGVTMSSSITLMVVGPGDLGFPKLVVGLFEPGLVFAGDC